MVVADWVWLIVGEGVVFAAASIEAKIRQRIAVVRWVWWHLVIVWAAWMAVTWVIVRIGQPAMHRAALRTVWRSQFERARGGWMRDPSDDDAPAQAARPTLHVVS